MYIDENGIHDVPMDDPISRQAAIKFTEMLYRDAGDDASYMLIGYNHALSDMRAVLKSLPSTQQDYDLSGYSDRLWQAAYELGKAEVKVKHGRWKGEGLGDYRCSLCGAITTHTRTNFCPNCGAKMDGRKAEYGDGEIHCGEDIEE